MSPRIEERASAQADPTPGDERARVLALVKQHGWNTTSFQVLEPGFCYWFAAPDACVAYVDTGRAWVAAGAPIAPLERAALIASAFCAEAARHRRRACFFATEHRFTALTQLRSLLIGEQPSWDPTAWAATLQQSRSLREQLRRARSKGVTVRPVAAAELSDPGAPARAAIEGLLTRWLRARPMSPMSFLVQLHLYSHPEERRCFVAEQQGRVVGVLGVVPIYARGGWFLEDLLRDPGAPNGTAELLVDSAMRHAATEGIGYATLGLAPLSGVQSAWLRTARQWSAGLYDFEGLRAFKAKLRPQSWAPIHVSYPAEQGVAWTLHDVLSAFAQEGVLRFGLRTLLRVPALVVRLLAVLLLPWIGLLSLARGPRWFPSPWVQGAWIAFDGVLLLALLALAQRWRYWLGTLLAVAVSADAVLTLMEVLLYNAPRIERPLHAVPLAVAVGAPSGAAVLLWLGRLHRMPR